MIKDLDRILYVLRGVITLQPQVNRMERAFELKSRETPYSHISNVVGSVLKTPLMIFVYVKYSQVRILGLLFLIKIKI